MFPDCPDCTEIVFPPYVGGSMILLGVVIFVLVIVAIVDLVELIEHR